MPQLTGWQRIPAHPAILRWAEAALPRAQAALVADPEPRRCGKTWAVGLDLLDNTPDGGIDGVSLPWEVLGLTPEPLHRAQISAIYPGYPQPDANESPAAYGFRLNRDAAHLDGLLPVGPDRQRLIREPHGWVLGLPLTDSAAAPLVVWEGSHEILRAALLEALRPHPPEIWGAVDVTQAYAQARKTIFARCPRKPLPAVRGEAILMHRLCLHGVAPWGTAAGTEPRIIAYFRPQLSSVQDWLLLP